MPLTVSTRKLGDFTLDGHVNAADVSAMLTALTDLNVYRTSRTLTGEDVLNIGDLDGDAHVTNADLQGLLAYLIGGHGSGAAAVPEPSTAILAAVGLIGLVVGRLSNRRHRAL